jgi:hypothetical protein
MVKVCMNKILLKVDIGGNIQTLRKEFEGYFIFFTYNQL